MTGGDRFVVAKTGAGDDQVEHLHHLGAKTPGESCCTADRGLPGDSALLVGSGAEWQVGDAALAVMGDHAVPGGPHSRQVGRHRLIDQHRTAGPGGGAGPGEQIGVWSDPDHNEHQVDVPADRPARRVEPVDMQSGGGPDADLGDRGRGLHSDPVLDQFGVDLGAKLGSTVGSTSGSISTWVTGIRRAVSPSAISNPT